MRRLIISLVAVVMLTALIPSTALAGKPLPAPTTNAVTYIGQIGDLVQSQDTVGVWNTRDGDKDYVFQLDLAPTTSWDLVCVKMTGPGTWDTVPGDGTWAIGVTTTLHGKLINNANSSINTMDLASGLRLYLHLESDGYLYDGAGELHFSANSNAGCTTAGAILDVTL